ncbi:hypothetical protein MU774_22060, partial [Salmonella enterica subsp. enterica serovar Enteritidis]|nr:hypothetical protein [Salmonella enterica subsp. enterica serovar Enteritidis]
MEGIETLSLRLDENETMALAQFVKRLSWSDLRGCAVSDEEAGTVAKLAMRQPFVLFKGLTFQKLCLPGAFRPGDHHN